MAELIVGEMVACDYAIDCIVCEHSVPLNSVRLPAVPICSECLEAIRELVAERRAKER